MSNAECAVCCEEYSIRAKYGCRHAICYKCATKMLFLYSDRKCPICKESQQKPVFESVAQKNTALEEAEDKNFAEVLDSLRISKGKRIEDETASYESEFVHKKVKELLLIRCKECRHVFESKKDVVQHYKTRHSSLLCTTCIDNNHQFWYEYVSYNFESLSQHRKGALKEPGFQGHVLCPYCSIYLYNKDEAKKHCNAMHQLCTVCDVMGIKFQYYANFAELEHHYHSQHFCCNNPLCVKNLCYVYAYKSELWAHSLSHHGLDIQLSEITAKNIANPQVFSLFDKGDRLSESEESLYRQPVNVVDPNINEPYFPSFSANRGSRVAGENVPSFLNRSILTHAENNNKIRMGIVKVITPIFYEEISASIEKFMSGMKELAELVREMEDSVGAKVTLKILENVPFNQKQKQVRDFGAEYKKNMTFPAFKKKPRVKEPAAVKNREIGFRVVDFSKKK